MLFISKKDSNRIKQAVHYISQLVDGDWQIEIKPYKRNLTAQQRAYYHKLLQIISEYCGEDIDDLKTRMCFTLGFVKEVKVKNGNVFTESFLKSLKAVKVFVSNVKPLLPTEWWRSQADEMTKHIDNALNSRSVIVRCSTETLKREEYSEMIQAAQMACMELGLQFPEPRQYDL